MNEQEQTSQLSALFDGELPPHQAELVIRRALKDPALRAGWERYALIGACLRDEPLQLGVMRTSVADRVRAALAAEAEHAGAVAMPKRAAAPVRSSPDRSWITGRGALGGAIAAGVAVVSIFLVRWTAPDVDAGALVAQGAALQAVDGTGSDVALAVDAGMGEDAAPGYTTPVDNSPAGARPDARLVSYVVAHSDVAQSAFRFGPMSAVMAGAYDPTQGAVEMTEAEIGARR